VSLRDEQGFTLVELLVAITISLVLLSATLVTFENVFRAQHVNDARIDSAERARVALDVQARQLRNLAKRLNNQPVIDTVSSYDLIFQTSDPTRTWVRYCLNTSTAPASIARGRLWSAELSLPVAAAGTPGSAAMKASCPGPTGVGGWTKTRVVADFVTNRRSPLERPLFTYTCTSGSSACMSSPTTYDQLVNISAQTIVDTTPGRGAPELRVATGVYLRNQNQAPAAAFVWTIVPHGTLWTVGLNASGSTDFEGRTLNYYWFKNTLPAASAIDCANPTVTTSPSGVKTLWGSNGYIGEGITVSYDGVSGSTSNVGLIACDPGDRFGTVGIPTQSTIAVHIP